MLGSRPTIRGEVAGHPSPNSLFQGGGDSLVYH